LTINQRSGFGPLFLITPLLGPPISHVAGLSFNSSHASVIKRLLRKCILGNIVELAYTIRVVQ